MHPEEQCMVFIPTPYSLFVNQTLCYEEISIY